VPRASKSCRDYEIVSGREVLRYSAAFSGVGRMSSRGGGTIPRPESQVTRQHATTSGFRASAVSQRSSVANAPTRLFQQSRMQWSAVTWGARTSSQRGAAMKASSRASTRFSLMKRVGLWRPTSTNKIGNETLARSWRRAVKKAFPRSWSDRAQATAGTYGSSFLMQSLRRRPAGWAPF
jgi:hypothetical protein